MPAVGPMTYAFDPTGLLPANKITNELHTLTAANYRDYHYLVPTYAPFFEEGLVIEHINAQNVVRTLHLGVDYLLAFPFWGATKATAKPIYGAISFLNLQLTGIIKFVNYQTIGGEWTIDVAKWTEIMANVVFNPRTTTWERVTGTPNTFPVIDHEWDLVDMVGMHEVVTGLHGVETAILQAAQSSANSHFSNTNNPHFVTKAQIGLDKVLNFAPATVQQAVAGTSADTLVTPLGLKAVLDNFGLTIGVPDEITNHLTNYNNPHHVNATQVGLGLVSNLRVVTSAEITAGAPVNAYLTFEKFLEYIAQNGGEVTQPPSGTLIGTYCDTTTPTTKMGRYADGSGGTYTEVIALNSPDCGFTQPVNGTLLQAFCTGTTRVGRYSDGHGGTYDQVIANNSPLCGYVAPPAYGTLLRKQCDGTTQVGVYANGTGGEYTATIKTNATECGYQAVVWSPRQTGSSTVTAPTVGVGFTVNFTFRNLSPGAGFEVTLWIRPANGNWIPWEDPAYNGQIRDNVFCDANGSASFSYGGARNNGGLAAGWYEARCELRSPGGDVEWVSRTVATFNIIVNRSVAMTLTPNTVSIGVRMTRVTTLVDFQINRTWPVYYWGYWESTGTDHMFYQSTITTNAMGRASLTEDGGTSDAGILGTWRVWAVVDGLASPRITMVLTA